MTAHWQERPEAGSPVMIKVFVWFALRIGRSFARVILGPIAVYFFLVRSAERKASRKFLSRALGREPSIIEVFRHFHTFAKVVLDRLFLLTRPDAIDKVIDGVEGLDEVLDSGSGLILLGAHLGSFEVARLLQRERPEVPLRVLIDRDVNAQASAIFDALGSNLDDQIIDRSVGQVSVALKVAETLGSTGAVGILADRHVLGEPVISIDFMGAQAKLPRGPFELATVTRVPVFLFLGLYEGGNRYRLLFRRLDVPQWKGRAQRKAATEALAGNYAAILGEQALQYPYNWFNFFEYWEDA